MATKKPPSDGLPIPFESLLGVKVIEPTLNENTLAQVKAAIANFTHKARWEKWGLYKIKDAGSVVLLVGPSVTGKTTTARWLAKQVGTGFISMSMADIGGSDPGATERGLKRLFQKAIKEGNTTIFMDECDGLLWDRSNAGPDSMWMITVINSILVQIEKFGGLMLMATNRDKVLDPALNRRISDKIYIGKPDFQVREILWEEKIPIEFPLQPMPKQIAELAKYELTGAEIENCIIAEAKKAMVEGRHPKFESLCNIAKSYEQPSKTR